MSNSGRKINYAVRPAKNIERKMMRDFFIKLSLLGRLEDYRYVGFGSKYFSDFSIFHKALNISEMISIEADVNNKQRYEFNKPFANINMVWGHSSDVLPKIVKTSKKTIYWLDYDGKFEPFMLQDVSIVAEEACSGSVLVVSFNCDSPIFDDGNMESLREALVKQSGKEFVPNNLELRGWKLTKTVACFFKNCLKSQIASVLTRRNYSIERPEDKLICEQKLFFTYADGAPMATIGFLFLSVKDHGEIDKFRFDDLYFVKKEDDSFDISIPNLTIKEIRHLMEIRPNEDAINDKIFAAKDARALWENYRYFPGFAELESF